jgi:hypothetical protein
MILTFRKGKAHRLNASELSGGWYADPYGIGARRWYDSLNGWSHRVEGPGQPPEKTGMARLDEAAVTPVNSPRHVGEDGKPAPLSRPVDAQYLATARKVT